MIGRVQRVTSRDMTRFGEVGRESEEWWACSIYYVLRLEGDACSQHICMCITIFLYDVAIVCLSVRLMRDGILVR